MDPLCGSGFGVVSDREHSMQPRPRRRGARAHAASRVALMSEREGDRTERKEAEAILRRVADDQRSMLAPGAEAAPAEPAEGDRVEVWGKRTGRIIGYGLLIILTINLFTGWFF